jgi:galacturan 1,4-alpha-galacturonidase
MFRQALLLLPFVVLALSSHANYAGTSQHPWPNRALEIYTEYYDPSLSRHRTLCTLRALGGDQDDSANFVQAVATCGTGGIIRMPDAKYTIGQPMDITLVNATLDVHGWMTWTPDISYWVLHNIPLGFQNLGLAWVIRGSNFIIDGNGLGGIDGNGQVWYEWAAGVSNKPGRPMSMAIVNATDVTIRNWSIVQPQFWASIVIESENVLFDNFYVNATAHGKGTIQNTDGSDTYRSRNVTYQNMIYQGGDDCIAFKPNSTDIVLRNISCYGGMGIAFGSMWQYPGRVCCSICQIHMFYVLNPAPDRHCRKHFDRGRESWTVPSDSNHNRVLFQILGRFSDRDTSQRRRRRQWLG